MRRSTVLRRGLLAAPRSKSESVQKDLGDETRSFGRSVVMQPRAIDTDGKLDVLCWLYSPPCSIHKVRHFIKTLRGSAGANEMHGAARTELAGRHRRVPLTGWQRQFH